MTNAVNELYDVTLNELSLVDRGANQGSEVILFKRDKDEEPDMTTITQAEHDAIKKSLTDSNVALTQVTKALEEQTAELDKISKRNEDLEKEVAELKKGSGGGGDGGDEIEKMDASPEVKKMLRAQQERIAAAEGLIKKQADDKAVAQLVTKFDSLNRLTTTGEKLAPIMHRVAKGESTQADADELERILKAANEAITTGKSKEQEIGKSGGGGNGDAMTKVNAKAAELRKNDNTLTKEQAISKVLKEDPDLYEAYLEETA